MQAFEIEADDVYEVESSSQRLSNNNNEGGMIGGLLTKYNLFGGGDNARGSYDAMPATDDGSNYYGTRSSSSDGGCGGYHRRRIDPQAIVQDMLRSSPVRYSLAGLVVLAVILHLSMDSSSSGNANTIDPGGSSVDTASSFSSSKFPHGNAGSGTANRGNHNKNDNMMENTANSNPAAAPTSDSGTNSFSIGELQQLPPPPKAHSFSFGGDNNKGHNPTTAAAEETPIKDDTLLEEIEEDATAYQGTWDLSFDNLMNEHGHYIHDPELSPFASGLYAGPQTNMDERQSQFTDSMQAVRLKYGAWKHLGGEDHEVTPSTVFNKHSFRDVAEGDFPEASWQKDEAYIRRFIAQAEELVDATMEGIRKEYGHPDAVVQEGYEKLWPFDVNVDDFDVIDGVAIHRDSFHKIQGIAFLGENSWKGLCRKLLHAMITEDYYYVVVAGREKTYGANNFAQSQVMLFNDIMEPIFHKLGMTLVSRNMGMNASTAVSALGGGDIYGETDILWHIEDANEEEQYGEFDLLHRQAIMSGERVPIIFSSNTDELTLSSKSKAWVGNLQPGADMCSVMDTGSTPPACENVNCTKDGPWRDGCRDAYNSVCWEERSDYAPAEEQNQNVDGQNEEYPGYRHHQLEGRKMSLLHLHAIAASLKEWREKLDGNHLPLASNLWHVGDSYTDIRESIMTLKDRNPGEAVAYSASCELLLKELDPRICHIPMHAFTEWTPRVIPRMKRLASVINNFLAGEVSSDEKGAYVGPDVLPLKWQVPEDQLDVHMITIATEVYAEDGDGDVDDDDIFETDDHYDWHDGFHVRKLRVKDDQDTSSSSVFEDKFRKKRNSINQNEKRNSQNKIPNNKNKNNHAQQDLEYRPTARRTHAITEGSGWRLENAPIGFCDGSAQSACNRSAGNKCLLANHNHYQGSIVGSSNTGWLTMSIFGARHGIILARLDFGEPSTIPDDLLFEYSVNRIPSVPISDLNKFGTTIVDGLSVYPLLLPPEDSFTMHDDVNAMTFDVAIRIQSEKRPDYEVRLSHLYYG